MSAPNCLLAPVQVDALVINQDAAEDGWSPANGNLYKVRDGLANPGPGPFFGAEVPAGGAPQPAAATADDGGVYVRWVVPEALRHARGKDMTGFLPLPDRWLLVRFCRTADDAAPRLTTWFVQSAAKSKTAGSVGNVITEDHQVTGIGRVDLLADASVEKTSLTLTALGTATTGQPYFTSTVAGHLNVFSFHDPLSDRQASALKAGKSKTSLSYLVIGWTSSPGNDPLARLPQLMRSLPAPDRGGNGVSWEAPSAGDVLNALDWQLLEGVDAPGDLLAGRCVFHGLTASINYWDQPASGSDTTARYWGTKLGHPGSSPVAYSGIGGPSAIAQVGVGETAAGAVAAVVQSWATAGVGSLPPGSAAETLNEMLEAALIGKRSRPDESTAPHHADIHRQQFRGLSAGVRWRVVLAKLESDQLTRGGKTGVTPEISAKLDALNAAQRRLDQACRKAMVFQQQLSGIWWWWAYGDLAHDLAKVTTAHDAGTRLIQDVDAQLPAKATAAQTLASHVADLAAQRNSKYAALHDALPAGKLELFWAGEPTFAGVIDPVLAIGGLGPPMSASGDEPLTCRLPGQVVEAVALSWHASPVAAATAVARGDLQALVSSLAEVTPAAIQAVAGSLLKEAVLAESTIAALVTRSLGKTAAGKTRQVSNVDDFASWVAEMEQALASPQAAAGLTFKAPGSVAVPAASVGRLWGKQPWSPRFLDWHVVWSPVEPASGGFGSSWTFQGEDYVPSAGFSSPATSYPVSGRTVASASTGHWIDQAIDVLDKLLAKVDPSESIYTDATNWKATLGELKQAQLTMQPLGGFHQRLMGRDADAPRARPGAGADKLWKFSLPPKRKINLNTKELATLVKAPVDAGGSQPGSACLPSLAPASLAPPDVSSPLPAGLIRSGTLKIEQLWLVDDFGQWVDLIHPTRVMGTTLSVDQRIRYPGVPDATAALPPRVLQPGQLDFALLSASDPSQLAAESPGSNPICGWVIYNHVDRGLIFYDQLGKIQGELELRKNGGPKWECLTDPGSEATLDTLPNPTLKAFAQALDGPALAALMDVVDRALPLVAPAGPRAGGDSTLLAGRPLAIVNARLSLGLFGDNALFDPRRGVPEHYSPRFGSSSTAGTGDAALDALALPARLGCSPYTEDSLIGAFSWADPTALEAADFKQLVPFDGFEQVTENGPLKTAEDDFISSEPITVSFKKPRTFTLLIDPRGTVQATVGIFPARTLQVPRSHLTQPLRNMELSLRIGPVIDRGPRSGLPIPVARAGSWWCRARDDHHNAGQRPAHPPQLPPKFDGQPAIAYGGHLILYQPGTSLRPPADNLGSGLWSNGEGKGWLLTMPDGRVLDVQPSGATTASWTLWAYDAKDVANPLRGPAVASGAWSHIGSSNRLLVMGDGHVLDWTPGSPSAWRLWSYAPSAAEILGSAPVASGSWAEIGAGSELLAVPSGQVLDWVAGDGASTWKLWKYDPISACQSPPSDVLGTQPVAQGTWGRSMGIVTGHRLMALTAGQIADWRPGPHGSDWQLWPFDATRPAPLGTAPVSSGTWDAVTAGYRLAEMPDGLVLTWSSSTGAWSLWRRPFSNISEESTS